MIASAFTFMNPIYTTLYNLNSVTKYECVKIKYFACVLLEVTSFWTTISYFSYQIYV